MSKDTIYREDAIKAIEELRKEPHWLHDGDDYRVCGLSEAEDAVKCLPSANSHLNELSEAIENLCDRCDRPSEKELGEIILSAMTFGFSVGLEAPKEGVRKLLTDRQHEVVANGNCAICGKPLSGDRVFICEECSKKGADDE